MSIRRSVAVLDVAFSGARFRLSQRQQAHDQLQRISLTVTSARPLGGASSSTASGAKVKVREKGAVSRSKVVSNTDVESDAAAANIDMYRTTSTEPRENRAVCPCYEIPNEEAGPSEESRTAIVAVDACQTTARVTA